MRQAPVPPATGMLGGRTDAPGGGTGGMLPDGRAPTGGKLPVRAASGIGGGTLERTAADGGTGGMLPAARVGGGTGSAGRTAAGGGVGMSALRIVPADEAALGGTLPSPAAGGGTLPSPAAGGTLAALPAGGGASGGTLPPSAAARTPVAVVVVTSCRVWPPACPSACPSACVPAPKGCVMLTSTRCICAEVYHSCAARSCAKRRSATAAMSPTSTHMARA